MRDLMIAIRIFLALTVLTGIVYPLIVTGISQAAFRDKANGSLIQLDGKVVGSSLIGQPFDDPKYFWGRPSATTPMPYNAAASSGSNQGPTNAALKEAVDGRVNALKEADPENTIAIPTDLATASGSGLDPHISIASAEYQIRRVAKARSMLEETVRELVKKHTAGCQLGILGEPVVNVLELNLDLDGLLK